MKRWWLVYLQKMFSKNYLMNLFSFVAIFLAILSVFFTQEVITNLQKTTSSSYQNYYHINKLSLAKKEVAPIEGTSLNLVKISRPDINEMANLQRFLPQLTYEYNLSAFFSPYTQVKYGALKQKIECVSLTTRAENRKLLKEDNVYVSTFKEIIINREAANLLGVRQGHEVLLLWRSQNIINYHGEKIVINFAYDLNATIKAIVDEFSFMNEARVYYSYEAAKTFLQDNYCLDIYSRFNEKISYYDLIKKSKNSEELSAYSFFLFTNSIFEGEKVYIFFSQPNLQGLYEISSFPLQIKETLNATSKVTTMLIDLFMVILLIITVTIVIFASLYNFERGKKDITILASLGTPYYRLFMINIIPNLFLTLLANMGAIAILGSLSNRLNDILFSLLELENLFDLPNFLRALEWYVIVTLLINFIVSFSLFSYKFATSDLSTALKEE